MSDTDTILQALAQVIYQAGRLDERGLVGAPLAPPLDILLAEARSLFERLDALDALPTAQPPHSDPEGALAPEQVTRAQMREALRPFATCYHALSADDRQDGHQMAVAQVVVRDLERAAVLYKVLGKQG